MLYRDMRELLHPDDDLYSIVDQHIRAESEDVRTCFRLPRATMAAGFGSICVAGSGGRLQPVRRCLSQS